MTGMPFALRFGNYGERWAQMYLAFFKIRPKGTIGGISGIVPSTKALVATYGRFCLNKGGPGTGILVFMIIQVYGLGYAILTQVALANHFSRLFLDPLQCRH
jgi:hypothetical protein